MFFTKAGRILAYIALVFGLLRIFAGIAVENMTTAEGGKLELADKEFFQKRYLGGSAPGRAIDQGIYTVLLALALGTLAEISFSVRKSASLADFNFSAGKRVD